MILLAGGTGFAPIKAIVEHAIAENCQRPMFIYWGAKARIDLYQNALPEAWAAQHANIRYVPVLSAPAAGDAWTGRTGFRASGRAGRLCRSIRPPGLCLRLAGHDRFRQTGFHGPGACRKKSSSPTPSASPATERDTGCRSRPAAQSV